MNYVFHTEKKDYELKLTTRSTIQLEKKLGKNPLMIFGNFDRIPEIREMVLVLHASLQAYNHGSSEDDAITIFDEWISEGHTPIEFVTVIMDIYKASGWLKEPEEEKN